MRKEKTTADGTLKGMKSMQIEKRAKQEGWVYVFANPRLHVNAKTSTPFFERR